MIFPAIDLMDGGCVRLHKGDFTARTNYSISPLDVARSYTRDGAEWMHIVDLDGAKKEQTQQTDLILKIARDSGLKVQSGGGLREFSDIKRLLDGGVQRVVVGSLAVTHPQMVKFWLSELSPEKIVIALDVNLDEQGTPYPAIKGWSEAGTKTLWDVLNPYEKSGLKTILVTDISRDGVESGGNIDLYKSIMKTYPELDLITSGGVGSLDHVKALKALSPHGVIIGKALYENRFSLKEAIQC